MSDQVCPQLLGVSFNRRIRHVGFRLACFSLTCRASSLFVICSNQTWMAGMGWGCSVFKKRSSGWYFDLCRIFWRVVPGNRAQCLDPVTVELDKSCTAVSFRPSSMQYVVNIPTIFDKAWRPSWLNGGKFQETQGVPGRTLKLRRNKGKGTVLLAAIITTIKHQVSVALGLPGKSAQPLCAKWSSRAS